jgi:hypothetical protein
MANWFDIGTHFFALLPIAVSVHYKQYFILVFMILATSISTFYHSNEDNKEFHYLDHFFSSGLVSLTFLLYLEHAVRLAAVTTLCLAAFTLIEYLNDVVIITWFVGAVAIGSTALFLYEKEYKKNKSPRFDYYDMYFIGFFVTQLIAIFFFLWDKEPYSHSFWHLFAYTSLACVLAHCGYFDSKMQKSEDDEKIDSYLFFWLGWFPIRIYVAYVLIDWGSTTQENSIPIALAFLILAGSILVNKKWNKSEDSRNRILAYSIISGILFFGDKLELAGGILIADTALSGLDWFRKNVWTTEKKSEKEDNTVYAMDQIELARLVF